MVSQDLKPSRFFPMKFICWCKKSLQIEANVRERIKLQFVSFFSFFFCDGFDYVDDYISSVCVNFYWKNYVTVNVYMTETKKTRQTNSFIQRAFSKNEHEQSSPKLYIFHLCACMRADFVVCLFLLFNRAIFHEITAQFLRKNGHPNTANQQWLKQSVVDNSSSTILFTKTFWTKRASVANKCNIIRCNRR